MTARILLWDLETSNLNANFGFIISASYKWLGEDKVHTVRIDKSKGYNKDRTNDKEIVEHLGEVISQADMMVTHYGKRFDFPYLQTRRMVHGLDPLPPVAHVDTWWIARYRMKLNSNRLDTLARFLGCAVQKTAVSGPHWVRAMAGHKDAIDYVVDHGEKDVLVLEEVYLQIRPLFENHPNVTLPDGPPGKHLCPRCGSDKLQKRGWTIARVARRQRYQCTSCGSWSSGRPVRVEGVEVR